MHHPPSSSPPRRRHGRLLLLVSCVALLCAGWFAPQGVPARAEPAAATSAFLPLLYNGEPWISPFGVQAEVPLTYGKTLSRTLDLNAGWARIGAISWRRLQPEEGGPIQWDQLAGFEAEMRTLNEVGISPNIIVLDSPRWATINQPFITSCGAIRADKFPAFAAFMQALVERYGTPEFNVRHWELGNELDVDPRLVGPDSGFGCWGDMSDPFYGGRHYGEMLKVVAPVMREADPQVRIWLGGLLLDRPQTADPSRGRPEQFLRGVLEAGAAPYFDVLPYHAYPPYVNRTVDHDNGLGGPWDAWGGMVVGKARFLRQIMAEYGVDKPLFLNETALMCPDHYPYDRWCSPPDVAFFEMQSNHLVRSFTRALAEGVEGIFWYTINGPGWRYTGLLDPQADPGRAYMAYQTLGAQLDKARYAGTLDYGPRIEAYDFARGAERVHVIWAKNNETLTIAVPESSLVAAYTRDGAAVNLAAQNGVYRMSVGFEPVYLVRKA